MWEVTRRATAWMGMVILIVVIRKTLRRSATVNPTQRGLHAGQKTGATGNVVL